MNKKANNGVIIGVIAVVVVIAIWILTAGFDTVEPSHKGVKVEFSKITGIMNPGLEWTGVFTDVIQYDLKTKRMDVILGLNDSAVDMDGQAVYANIQINYRVSPDNLEKAYSKIGLDKDLATILNINGVIKEGFKTVTSKYTSLEMFQKRAEIKTEAIKIIQENFPSDYFILENVVVSNIGFDKEFTDAIKAEKVNERLAVAKEKEVVIAEQQALITKAQAEGERFARQERADADAYEILKIAEAEADALRMKRQEISELLVQSQWINQWDGQLPLYVMGSNENTEFLMQVPEIGVQ